MIKTGLILVLVVLVFGLLFPTQVEAGCNGGNVTGAYYMVTCNYSWCVGNGNPPGCICSNTCTGVTLWSEFCSDYTDCDSCVAINFSGMDCGNKGRCNWNGSYSCACIPGATTCGPCSVTCGGGTQTCTDGCSSWSQSCNTQPCCPSVSADIKVNDLDGPISVCPLASYHVDWTSSNAGSCTLDGQ